MTGRLEQSVRRRHTGPVVWFGIRAEDAQGVWWDGIDLRTVAFLGAADQSLETATGERVNPDLYELDDDPSEAAAWLIDQAIDLADGGVIVAYRPSKRLHQRAGAAGIAITAMNPVTQRRFENKLWVEQRMSELGLPTLGWRTVEVPSVESDDGPVVVRGPGGGGGTGMHLAPTIRSVPSGSVVSTYLDDALSVNLTGCCFPDGSVSVHLATLQLIGITECTDLDFGYCGNDAAALATTVESGQLDELQTLVRRVGSWLHQSAGWLGVFGVDALLTDHSAVFCEVNPRFQGSSNLVSAAARREGRPGLHVEHLAAFLGFTPGDEQLGGPDTADDAQVVFHNTTGSPVLAETGRWHDDDAIELLPPAGTTVAPGAPIARWRGRGPVTTDGRTLVRDPRGLADGSCRQENHR